MKTRFRLISLVMFLFAVVFAAAALSNPALGRTIYIGTLRFGAEQWRICYLVYIITMIILFAASFFVQDRNDRDNSTGQNKEN